MFDSDLAYLAGFFDGEGCVAAYVLKRPPTAKSRAVRGTRLYVTAANTDRRPLDRFAERFGGAVYVSDKGGTRTDGFNRRESFVWMLWGKAAQAALAEMLPFLVVKKAQAEEAMLIVMVNRGSNRGAEVRALDENIAARIKMLKKQVV